MAAVQSPPELTTKRGTILRVPSAVPTLQEAFDVAKPGDCIMLNPGEYTLHEPLLLQKPLHIIGVNEIGAAAKICMDGGKLAPAVPMLTIDAQDCRFKGVTFAFTHDEDTVSAKNPNAHVGAFAIRLREGKSVTFDECAFEFSVSGLLVDPSAYATLLCTKLNTRGTGVSDSGHVHLDRCEIDGSDVGIAVTPTGSLTCDASGVSNCEKGLVLQNEAFAKVEGSLFVDCETGILASNPLPPAKPSVIKGNEIVGCATGIDVLGERNATQLTKNFVHGCIENGIHLRGGTSDLKGNAVKGCLQYGIHVSGGNSLIEGNVVQDCRSAGILVHHARPIILANEIVGHKHDEMTVAILVYHPPAESPISILRGVQSQRDKQAPSVAEQELQAFAVELPADPLVPDLQADPTVESNTLGDNQCNIRIVRASGSYIKNELLASVGPNILATGEQVVSCSINENELMGSLTSSGVTVSNGAQAKIINNHITNSKLSAITLVGCGVSEVHNNVMDRCLDAIVAQRLAVARIGNNYTQLGIDIFTDSQETVVIARQ